MAFAIVPINTSSFESQESWLTMNQVDDMICKKFGVEPDKHSYYQNWFDKFWCFDWSNVKGFYHFDSNEVYNGFDSADKATLHFFKHQLHIWQDDMNLWDSVNTCIEYVQCYIEPIIKVIYDSGYKIISLNLG